MLVAALAGGVLVAGGGRLWADDLGLEPTAGAQAPVVRELPEDVSAPPAADPAPSQEARPSSAPTSPGTDDGARADPPDQVRIPGLDLRLPVTPQGVTRQGAMALPESPSVLGWYRYGSRPADAEGATVIAGHVDSVTEGVGPLAGLAGLAVGDRVEVRAGRELVRYEVTSVSRVDKDEIDLEAVFARDGRPRLHLVTCAGAYDAEAGGYQDNLVVAARRVDR